MPARNNIGAFIAGPSIENAASGSN